MSKTQLDTIIQVLYSLSEKLDDKVAIQMLDSAYGKTKEVANQG
jgi:hypothetical protein